MRCMRSVNRLLTCHCLDRSHAHRFHTSCEQLALRPWWHQHYRLPTNRLGVQVVFSPYLPAGFRYFMVTQSGIQGMPPAASAPLPAARLAQEPQGFTRSSSAADPMARCGQRAHERQGLEKDSAGGHASGRVGQWGQEQQDFDKGFDIAAKKSRREALACGAARPDEQTAPLRSSVFAALHTHHAI